jgi:hypothetical protein
MTKKIINIKKQKIAIFASITKETSPKYKIIYFLKSATKNNYCNFM